jgi:uncharacterized lipoprotein
MKTTLIAIATAAALGVLAGCDRDSEPRSAASGASGATPSAPQSSTPTTPANLGKPSQGEASPKAQPPVQGREDVRQPEQRRDFEQKGDAAGPKPGG